MIRRARLWVSLAAALIVSVPLMATTLGNLTGVVRMDGEPVADVMVGISSPALLGERTTVTDDNGRYSFQALPPGRYVVTFEKEGLQPAARQVRVAVARTERLDLRMNTPSVADAITVTAAAPAIVESSELQSSYDADLVDRLPVGRSLQSTALLAPGVSDTGLGVQGGRGFIVISGAPSFDNLYLIDGAVVNENVRGQAHNLFIEDAIDQTTVMTGAISAEFGRFTGGVVSAVTKSGGNDFSGSLRDTLSNPAWNSESRLRPRQDDDLSQILEGTLGGRIVTDRLWFFSAGRYYERDVQSFLAASRIPYVVSNQELRYEVKLTGQLSPRHSLVGALTQNDMQQKNNCQFGCLELSTVDPEISRPTRYTSARYNGIFGDALIVEGGWAEKDFSLVGFGGEERDVVNGTWGYDEGRRAYFGAPLFCGVCGDHERDSSTWHLKGNYYLSTERAGTHSLVAGYEHWVEQNLSNNYQSASDFGIVTLNSVDRDRDGVVRPVFVPGATLITYYPILQTSQGTDFVTASFFINDRWDINQHWSLNVGLRYDGNDGRNSVGAQVVDDGALSPRLAASYDLRGDGRTRFNGSFSRYVTKVAGVIGESSSPGGNPAYYQWVYEGPSINTDGSLDSRGAIERVFQWFFDNGGTSRSPDLSDIPGVTSIIDGSLQSPSVDEWTLGFGRMIGRSGFIRADWIKRDWQDFYSRRVDRSTGFGRDPLGNKFDLAVVENTNDLERQYKAVQLQAGYRIYGRLNLGGSYTWSELRGNVIDESLGSGPMADDAVSYPEYKSFDRHNPTGFLPSDQTHRLRFWTEMIFPTSIGDLGVALLQRYESGTPYEVAGRIRPDVVNPGYATPPTRVTYFFTDRGSLRWDDINATDLALNFSRPFLGTVLFLQGEVFNLFDRSAQIGGDTTVLTHVTNPGELRPFNPYCTCDRPQEGVHYRLGPLFGKAISSEHYQQPRTVQVSAGVRF